MLDIKYIMTLVTGDKNKRPLQTFQQTSAQLLQMKNLGHGVKRGRLFWYSAVRECGANFGEWNKKLTDNIKLFH